MFTLLLLSIFLVSQSSALNCHYCAGAENIPSYAGEALTKANVTTSGNYWGNCKATSGSDVCSNGLFCVKQAKVYKFSLEGIIGFSWTTYEKGCANTRIDNGLVPLNQCYDINSTQATGYTMTVRHCYCQGNLCNSSPGYSAFFGSIFVLSSYFFTL